MDKENVICLHIRIFLSFKTDIIKFTGKWIKLEKNPPMYDNPDAKKLIRQVLIYMWMLVIKSLICIIEVIHRVRDLD